MSGVNDLRIKRRAAEAGSAAPTTLLNSELAFNEASRTLYYGLGVAQDGITASQIIPIAGSGAFVDRLTDQSIEGVKTFTESPVVPTPVISDNSTKVATTAFVKATVAAVTIADGDKGDISVSNNGSTWTIDTSAVTNAKLANMATGTIKGRASAGTGNAEDLTAAQVRSLLSLDTMYQGLNANLGSLAGLTLAADRGLYSTGANTLALYTLTAGGRALAGAAGTANTLPYFSAANTVSLAPITAFARTILDDVDGAAVRATIGAGVGSVTSVNIVPPTGMTVAGGPVTSAGSITLGFAAGYQAFTTAEANAIAGIATTYVPRSMINQANGVAGLGADGKISASALPALAITDTFPVANQAAMLALEAEKGDVAIRTDQGKSYILRQEPASTLANWSEILTPNDGVKSVNISGGTTGLTASGGPITNTGTFTLGGVLAVAHGGTGANNAAQARTNLGLGTMATQNANNVAITGGTIGGIIIDGGTY